MPPQPTEEALPAEHLTARLASIRSSSSSRLSLREAESEATAAASNNGILITPVQRSKEPRMRDADGKGAARR